jgi:hypothetical protein
MSGLESMPDDVTTVTFDAAGRAPEGPAHITVDEWEYLPPGEGKTGLGILRAKCTIIEKPGKPGMEVPVSDSFFLDHQSLWKMRELAIGCGVNYGEQETNWKAVARDCVGRDCWVNIANKKAKDGNTYARFTAFGSNLQAVMGKDTDKKDESKPSI